MKESMAKYETLIVGYGITGHNLENEIKRLNPDIADIKIYGTFAKKEYIKYDAIFICVDTPYVDKDNPCDLSAIRAVLSDYRQYLKSYGVFVIKSTILPGTTEKLIKEFDTRIVHSPEYYGNTQHCQDFEFNFTILGGKRIDCVRVQQILQYCHNATHTFRIVDSNTTELAKYMENCYLAMKVDFCCQFYHIAEQCGVDYEMLRELFVLDPRVNPSHTFVYRDAPYFQSHCLDKDTKAIAYSYDAEFLTYMIEFNQKLKQKTLQDKQKRE